MPGSGKSTVGKEVARQLGGEFVDSDREIELRSQATIAALFARDGETAFRDLEAATLRTLVEQGAAVIATGGGAILRAETRDLIRRQTRCVYLHASPQFLWRRLRRDRRRPLLQVPDPLGRLVELSEVREPLYRETAHVVINIEAFPFDRLVDEVLRRASSASTP